MIAISIAWCVGAHELEPERYEFETAKEGAAFLRGVKAAAQSFAGTYRAEVLDNPAPRKPAAPELEKLLRLPAPLPRRRR